MTDEKECVVHGTEIATDCQLFCVTEGLEKESTANER